jgi:hypothetical protein
VREGSLGEISGSAPEAKALKGRNTRRVRDKVLSLRWNLFRSCKGPNALQADDLVAFCSSEEKGVWK